MYFEPLITIYLHRKATLCRAVCKQDFWNSATAILQKNRILPEEEFHFCLRVLIYIKVQEKAFICAVFYFIYINVYNGLLQGGFHDKSSTLGCVNWKRDELKPTRDTTHTLLHLVLVGAYI